MNERENISIEQCIKKLTDNMLKRIAWFKKLHGKATPN